MRDMFNGCSLLTTLNLSNFITKKVTNMSNMFNGCSLLANLNLSNFDVKNVNVMWNMFHGCVSLKPKFIFAMLIHIGLTVVVYCGVVNADKLFLPLAIVLHMLAQAFFTFKSPKIGAFIESLPS